MEKLQSVAFLTYIEILILCVFLCVQQIFTTHQFKKKGIISTDKSIFCVYASFLVLFLCEIFEVIFSHYFLDMIMLSSIACGICYVAMLATPIFWLLFSERELGIAKRIPEIIKLISITPAMILSVISITSIWTGSVFVIDPEGFFVRGPLAIPMTIASLFYYLMACLQAIFKRTDSKTQEDIYKCRMMIFFCSPIIVALFVQIFIGEGVGCIGYILSLCSIFVNGVLANGFTRKISEEKAQYNEIIASDREKLHQETIKNKYTAIIENLIVDYESVSYVTLGETIDDDLLDRIRDSEYLIEHIPGWAEAVYYSVRIILLSSHMTSDKERNEFLEKTQKSTILIEFATENVYYVDFSIVIDDSRHYYQIKYTAQRNEEGIIKAIVIGFRNIDDLVKSQNDLIRLEQERFEQQAFTNLFVDTYTAAYYVNLSDYTYVEYKLKDYLKDRFTKFNDYVRTMANYIENNVYDDDKELMYRSTNPVLIRHKMEENEQFIVVYRDKSREEQCYRNMIVARGHDSDHVAVGFIDVSEQFIKEKAIQENLKSYIETIEKQQEELEEANKSKTNFLFNMSHDIRTPMNAIIGYTDLAKEHINETESTLRFLDKIALSGEHLLKLINEILDMSRVEGGNIKSELVVADVEKSASKIVDICKEEAYNREIELNVDLTGGENRLVTLDELHVNRILMNVLSNAIKYTERGGKVSFKIRELPSLVDGYLRFEYVIEDNGIGMSQEFLEHIYDSFSRERTSTVSGIQGTGLGMAIVKKLVEYMDGSINIESEVSKGTKVTIVLQYLIPEEDSISNDSQYSLDGSLKDKKILFVDDNDINREIVCAILAEEGVIMSEAVNGKDAIDLIAEKGIDYFDCILMDIQMPVMNGYEATEYLRKTYPDSNIPIIALSANAFEEDKKKSMASGMNAHVSKPVSAEVLYKTVTKYMQNKE